MRPIRTFALLSAAAILSGCVVRESTTTGPDGSVIHDRIVSTTPSGEAALQAAAEAYAARRVIQEK